MEDNNPNQHTGAPSFPPPPSHHHLLQQQQQQLQMFWTYQQKEIEQANDFKNHQLPLARIKKIMKSDEDVRMISAESPVIFAKACELFILELTIRSWLHAEENRRRTLQRNDVAAAITRTEIFDFLVDIVPKDEIKEDDGLFGGMAQQDLPYYYSNMGQPVMGQPAMDPSVFGGWQGGEDGAYGGNGQRNDNGRG